MTAPQPNPQPNPVTQAIHFQGTTGVANGALEKILQESGDWQKLLGKALRINEGDSGLSVVTFFQNNMVALLPKWLVSRSPLETTEFSFLELAESSLLYFALPFVGNQVFKPFFNHLAKKELANVATKDAAKVGVKAATILSTFGVTLVGGEFMTHYVKNLMTAKIFKKDRFSDIVNLSQGQIQSDEPSQVVQKCQKRIKQCLAACAGILGASVILAKGSASQKENILTRLFSKPASKSAAFLTKNLDFTEKNGKLFLSKHQMRLYMGLAVFAYLDSARDKLERVETATRLALILPYLAFGQGLLEKGMMKLAPQFFAPILKSPKLAPSKENPVLSLRELAVRTKGAGEVTAKTAIDFADPLKRKAVLMGAPLAVGIFGTGIGVGLLNRFWTQYRYNQQVAQQKKSPLNKPGLPTPQVITSPQSMGTSPAPFSAYSNAPELPGFSPYTPNNPTPPIVPAMPAALPFSTPPQTAMRYPYPNNANPLNPAATAYRI